MLYKSFPAPPLLAKAAPHRASSGDKRAFARLVPDEPQFDALAKSKENARK
jgi:hypothetical protein